MATPIDKHVTLVDGYDTLCVLDPKVPKTFSVTPVCADHGMAEFHVLSQSVFFDDVIQILPDLGSSGIIL